MNELVKAQSFFDIQENIKAIINEVEANGGEITPELEIKLSDLEMAQDAKIANVGAWVKTLDAQEAGIETIYNSAKDSLERIRATRERLKSLLWSWARMAKIIWQDDNGDWQSRKVSNGQVTVSWRRSEGIAERPDETGYKELSENFPHFFKREIVCTPAGWSIIKDLIDGGDITVRKEELSKTQAKEYLKNTKIGVSGLRLEKRINPVIKVG